jgi:hypothetical protein
MPTPTEVISIAEISQYLWNDDIAKGNGLFGGVIDPFKARQLYMERKSLQYGIDQTLSGINGVANYVYALCGSKVQVANLILQVGGGGAAVIAGGGGFGVREYSGFASVGLTTIVFPDAINTQILYASRGGIDVQAILTSGVPVDSQVLWTSSTGTLTVAAAYPFYDGEYVRILVK